MVITGSCHCGSTSFEINGEIPRELARCTCSFCSKAGRVIAYYRPDQFRLTSAPDKLGTVGTRSKSRTITVLSADVTHLPTARPISRMARGTARPGGSASMPGFSIISTRPRLRSRSLTARTFGSHRADRARIRR
jgi:hypothetical protein